MSPAAINQNRLFQEGSCTIGDALESLRTHLQGASQGISEPHFLKMGLANVDESFGGLALGAVTVLASRPSMGRSALALNIATNVSLSQNRTVLYMSLGMPIWQLAIRVASQIGGIQARALQLGKLSPDEQGRFALAIKQLQDAPLHLIHCSYIDIDTLCQRVREFASHQAVEHPLALVIVDDLDHAYLQKQEKCLDAAYEKVMYLLKKLAKDLHVAVLVLSGVKRTAEERENKRPIFTDLPSVALAQQSDALLFLYRDEVYHPQSKDIGRAELTMVSNRLGLTGTVYLPTDLQYGRFGVDAYRSLE
ncbi:DnaB-like helicase C-terminal domain-containing protein [Polynucleobacter sp. 78F-HAINBA]|jgi:replicative DNA helicase|uniref:DnaB-like helicase C-terminal domain-containing protein n=1 Tax=Polynucleobacter sp. 78F-HAINBA TaxID=2689099 RepID=UPI001C0CD80F|nr:DnaB-like helicase C-terminal domain-containing protein [Polynucleobacter sp. 78F-HAINBA]MBU3590433.1 DnaB-like helicase C-terminal domain-containing protein [Polynucleobacter sp. 78F-HAINBA]